MYTDQKDRKRGKVRGQVWLQPLQETKGQDRVKFKNEGETEKNEQGLTDDTHRHTALFKSFCRKERHKTIYIF